MVTYKEAGVDITAGERAVERMARYVRSTHSPQALKNSHGGFAGLEQLSAQGFAAWRVGRVVAGKRGVSFARG
jgi:phosphoribosylformylglycinamidine cyclo-ligase